MAQAPDLRAVPVAHRGGRHEAHRGKARGFYGGDDGVTAHGQLRRPHGGFVAIDCIAVLHCIAPIVLWFVWLGCWHKSSEMFVLARRASKCFYLLRAQLFWCGVVDRSESVTIIAIIAVTVAVCGTRVYTLSFF